MKMEENYKKITIKELQNYTGKTVNQLHFAIETSEKQRSLPS